MPTPPPEHDDARPVLILDRDGTLIDFVRDEETGFVGVAWHPRQLRLLPGVIEGLQALRTRFRFAIATNQPGPAKGQYTAAAMTATHDALLAILAGQGIVVEHVAACTHHPDGGPGGDVALVGPCDCRKPAPGLVLQVLEALGAPREGSWMVGDQVGDVRAGKAAGVAAALLLDTRRCELCPHKHLRTCDTAQADHVVKDLRELATLLLDTGV